MADEEGTSTGAVTVGIQGLASSINLFARINKPYGECAPNAPDAESFLACWKHAIPVDQIPYWKGPPTAKQPGTSGWDFAVCHGAVGGRAPVDGCGGTCNCSSAPCVCAPIGAIRGLRDGTFQYASGSSAGPAQEVTNNPTVNALLQTTGLNKGVSLAALGLTALAGIVFFMATGKK